MIMLKKYLDHMGIGALVAAITKYSGFVRFPKNESAIIIEKNRPISKLTF